MDPRHRLCADTLTCLAMDGVQKANSGHPGMPMGMADAATVLWLGHVVRDPQVPQWPDRDRFVLSAGHGSMLLYGLLHLSGYDLSLDDLKAFRQLHSKTPGHPEVGETPGVETTTGPLGQGFANGVGMAFAERALREEFGPELCDHWTYGIVSDGDLMEGVANEAGSLAGHLGLGRIVYLYDDNEITIDGKTDLAFGEDVCARYAAMGWHVQRVNGHDPAAIEAAIVAARAETQRPSLIACRTIIGKGADIEGTSKTHGAPLGPDRVAAVKKKLGWDPEKSFVVPDEALLAFRSHDGASRRAAWHDRLARHPRRQEFEAWLAGDFTKAAVNWPTFATGSATATRKASQACLKALHAAAPWLVGGSADLAESNGTEVGQKSFKRESFAGAKTIHFGVREHAMGSICNGIALHGGLRPYGATFLVFHDYMRPAVRLAGLMKQPILYVYTHDSVFLGEDGPTHQPIETLLALRALPNVRVFRPADGAETVESWKLAVARTDGPTALILTRQNLPEWPHPVAPDVSKGGYVLSDCEGRPQVVVLATGSEVEPAVAAAKLLTDGGLKVRVLSVPCRELLWAQPRAFRDLLLPPGVPRVSVEAAATLGWERYIGDEGLAIGIDTFGASAKASDLAELFGLTAAAIAAKIKAWLK